MADVGVGILSSGSQGLLMQPWSSCHRFWGDPGTHKLRSLRGGGTWLSGTDATHAEHIETIKARMYVGLTPDKRFLPGHLGMGLVEGERPGRWLVGAVVGLPRIS